MMDDMGTYRVAIGDDFTILNVDVDITIDNLDTSDILTRIYVGYTGPGVSVRVLSNLERAVDRNGASSDLIYEQSGSSVGINGDSKVIDADRGR